MGNGMRSLVVIAYGAWSFHTPSHKLSHESSLVPAYEPSRYPSSLTSSLSRYFNTPVGLLNALGVLIAVFAVVFNGYMKNSKPASRKA